VQRSLFRRKTARAGAEISVQENLPLVPEDRQRDQDDGNDPQDDVFATAFFATAFFFGHRRQYNTSEIPVSSAN
jgi:hypothetical protein